MGSVKIPTLEAVIEHERELAAEAQQLGLDPGLAIQKDRLGRWAELVAQYAVPEELVIWALEMEALHGPAVQVHSQVLDWITALVVVRYGEGEHHWPTAGFSEDDLKRAQQWVRQEYLPYGVRYIEKED